MSTPLCKVSQEIMIIPKVSPHENVGHLLGALLEELQDFQRAATRVAPLKPVPVVVPSVQFTDWLQVAIAKREGLCMGLEFMTPQTFVGRVIALGNSEASVPENPWSKRSLTWRLLPHIKRYAAQLGATDASLRDRFALAGLLADQFDQYGHFRPEMIAKWNRGESAAKGPWSPEDKAGEEWQRKLWRAAQSEIHASPVPSQHPVLMLEAFAKTVAFLELVKAAFRRVFVIGSGALDPLLVRVLGSLSAASCKIHAHVVLPSLGYLGGLRKSRMEPEQDPDSLEMKDGHPLLVSMGRHAVGSFMLMGEMDENYTLWPDSSQGAEVPVPQPSLLRCIQADIRQLREPSKSFRNAENDTSIRAHSCFGPRREMEVLRDELFRAFQDVKDLKPEDVVVVTPSLETYAPLVAAVLEQAPSLPIRLTELPPSEQDPTGEGLLALLETSRGDCEASTLLELLNLRAVRACLGVSEDLFGLESLRAWIRQSGLTRGLGEEGDSSEVDVGTWRFARDRMIAGKWFGSEADARYPGGDFVLPVADDLGGNLALKEAFVEWLWKLSRTLREWRIEAPVGEWIGRLDGACDQLLSSEGDEDARLDVQDAFNFLARVECTEPVDAGAMLDWLQAEFAEAGRRTPVSGRITFGRLKQLQNIPCRVLAMVGMQDGVFPRQNRIPAWDLLHLDPRAWDRNARIDDRQLFLDAVLNPTDRLIITASTRNVRTGKIEPFSSCVDELLRVARDTAQGKLNLIVEHRLQPFSPGYFTSPPAGGPLPLSFDSSSAKVAVSLAANSVDDRSGIPFWDSESPGEEKVREEPIEISVDQLAGFWTDPAKAFLRAQGIALAFDEENDEDLDRIPLDLDGLQKWRVKDSILQDILKDESSDYTKGLLLADRGLPPAELGNRTWDALFRIAEPLGNKVREVMTKPLGVDVVVQVSNKPPVRITGMLRCANWDGGKALLAYRIGKIDGARNYLQPWIQAVVAGAEGHSLRSYILAENHLESPPVLAGFAPDQAMQILNHLVRGFLEGQARPLCYAAASSDSYAKSCQQWGDDPDENAMTKASEDWNREPFKTVPGGEGLAPAARLAWRDQDPFAFGTDWHRWSRDIASPLQTWFAQ